MKICPTCGNEYPDDCNFCNACGVELVQKPQAQKQTLVENVTPITPTTLKEFYTTQRKIGIFATIFGGVMSLLWIIDQALELYLFEIGFLGMIILGCGIFLWTFSHLIVKNNKSITNETMNVYHFLEDEIHALEFNGKENRGEKRLYYREITSVKASGNYYQIQFGNLIWLVKKDGFTVGTEADFCRILREKCPQKVIKF